MYIFSLSTDVSVFLLENLRVANIGFKEGVVESSLVLAAQTAWLQAHSEEIDARIDRIMATVYLRQATGQLKLNDSENDK